MAAKYKIMRGEAPEPGASPELLRSLFEQSSDGIFIIDNKGRYLEVNPRGCEMLGYTREEMLARSISDLFPTDDLVQDPFAFEEMQKGATVLKRRRIRRKDGTLVQVELSTSMLTDGKFLGLARDLSERIEAEEKLRASEERLRKAQAMANVGNWELDLRTNQMWGSEEAHRIYGIGTLDAQLPIDIIQLLPLPGYRQTLDRALQNLISGKEEYDVTFEIARANDGCIRIVHSRAELVLDNNGVPSKVVGVIQDITERRQAERTLQERENHFLLFMNNFPGLAYIKDSTGHVLFASEGFRTLVGIAPEEIIGKTNSEVFPREFADQITADDTRVLESGQGGLIEEQLAGRVWSTYKFVLPQLSGPSLLGGFSLDITKRKSAEEALRRSETNLQLALEAARMGDWSWDIVTGEVVWSARCKALYGLSPETVVTYELFLERLHPEDRERIDAALKRAVEERSDYDVEKRAVWPDGSRHWTASRGRVFCNAAGEPVRMAGVSLDITERKLAEEALRESEQRFRTLAEASFEGIAISEQDILLDCSEQMARLLGTQPSEMVGKPVLEFIAPEHRDLVAEARRLGRLDAYEHRMRRTDGTLFPVETRARSAQIGGRQVRITAIRDITERKLAEHTLRAKELCVDRASIGIWRIGPAGEILEVNDEACRSLGYSRTELREMTIFDLDPTFSKKQWDGHRRSLRAAGTRTLESTHRRKDGGIFPVEITVNYFRLGDEEFSYSFTRDISERTRAAQALRENEYFLRKSQEVGDLGSYYFDARTGTWISSEKLDHIFGIDDTFRKTVRGWINLVHPDDKEEMTEHLTNHVITHHNRFDKEYRIIRHNDRQERWMHGLGELEFDAEGNTTKMIGTIQDITDRKQKEDALRKSEAEYRNLVETMPDGFYRSTHQGRFIFVNPAMVKMLGYNTKEELLEIDIPTQLYPRPEDRVLLPSPHPDFISETEVYQLRKKDGTLIWLEDRCRYLRDNDGNVLFHEGACRDITDRVLAEEERRRSQERIRQLNEELEQRVSERTIQLEAANKELEAFAYSVSHDLRAPLRAIDGFARILSEDHQATLDSEGQRVCSVIHQETERMGHLIDDLLEFSRLSRSHMVHSKIDMTSLASSIFYELTTTEVRTKLDFQIQSLPIAPGDPSLIRQVWTNLIANAIKFSSKRENPEIQIGAKESGNELVYSVTDNGAGFDMQYAGKLFGVFQRLHSTKEFEGTGVGLAIVQRIVHRHGGRVWAEGQPDQGATFYFTLPLKGT